MSLIKIVGIGLAEVFDAQLIKLLCTPQPINPIKDHFTLGARSIIQSLRGFA